MIKTKKEISLFKKSAAISNSCIPIIEKALKEENMTEREIARRVERNIRSQGATLSFRTLVACGDRSAMIHPVPTVTDRKISRIGYVDFGASYKGYKTDVTVPFIKGKVNSRERRIVKSVIDAYKIALKSWKIGSPCWKLHEKIDSYLKSKNLEMGHGLGHGLGKKIHETPTIAMPDKRKLAKVERLAKRGNKRAMKRIKRWERVKKVTFQSNMVFTIEPGAYVKGIGGSRLENSFLASGKKLKSLTRAKLIEVK
jgi:Xaa-Pro aminopeptidase